MFDFNFLWEDYKRNSNLKYCFYHDHTLCVGKIKKAHSLQKEKILTQLESPINGNNLIYSLSNYKVDKDYNVYDLTPIGKNKASIFTGFCDYHDSHLFAPIENFPFIASSKQLFLITYRAFAHSFHQVLELGNYYTSNGNSLKYYPKDFLQDKIEYNRETTEKLLFYKKLLDYQIEAKIYDSINYHLRIIKPCVPLACSSILSPYFTYKNIFLDPLQEPSTIILNIIPDKIQTVIIISHFSEDYKGKLFFDELKTLTDLEFSEAISSLLIFCTGNTFFSPLLWDRFTIFQKHRLYSEMNISSKYGGRLNKFFLSRINFFTI